MFCQSLALGLLGSRVVYALKEPYTLVYPVMLQIKFDCDRATDIFMYKSVNGRINKRTDAGSSPIL